METHGNTVSWTDDGVTAWASTQGISSVRDGLAGALQLDHSQVRVITEYMGGGFGSKFGARRRGRAGRAAFARGESAGPADAHAV